MKVPFGDMKIHYQTYKEQIDTAVQRVLESGHYILGPELERFEKNSHSSLAADTLLAALLVLRLFTSLWLHVMSALAMRCWLWHIRPFRLSQRFR